MSNINKIFSLLEKNGFSLKKDNHQILGIDDNKKEFYLDYNEDYFRLIMKDNNVSFLYDIANLVKKEIGIPTLQYWIVNQNRIDITHPTLEWRFDDKEKYITNIINYSVLTEEYKYTNIKLFNGKEIKDYQKNKTFIKK